MILGSLTLVLLLIASLIPLALIAQNFQEELALVVSSYLPSDPEFLTGVLTSTVGLFFTLELVLVILFIPSSYVAGYVAGSRSRGKWIGVAFFFFTVALSVGFGFFNVGLLLLTVILVVFFPLALLTSISLGWLGGLKRDKKKLYPIDPELKLARIK